MLCTLPCTVSLHRDLRPNQIVIDLAAGAEGNA
jgi:hypothetical protein